MRQAITCGILAALAAVSVHAGPASAASAERAQVVVTGSAGSSVFGLLNVTATPDGVRISGTLRGISPNTRHGFHIHEIGDCSADRAMSAGGHFNPGKRQHGDPARIPHHAGDLPNIDADASGTAVIDMIVKGVTLDDSAGGVLNRAIVVNAKADDYTSQPAGAAGPRIACGVISAGK